MMTFGELYGVELDTELGSEDRSQRFTLERRKAYVNEGQRLFNEQTSCFVKRAPIALTSGVSEYDLEAAAVIDAADYLWPSKTSASLRRTQTSDDSTSYVEGPDLLFRSEEELNWTRSNWRAESPATPELWTLRTDGGAQYLVLVPAPEIPATESWSLLWPYVAQPANMTADAQEPYSASGNVRSTLRPYHRALVHYAAAQLEKRRKDWDAVQRQMQLFAAYVLKFAADAHPLRGSSVRLRIDYRARLQRSRPLDPTRWP